jgi:hypothetical protein
MRAFIKSLFSADGEISSKRVIAFLALLLFITEVICNLCRIPIDQNIIYATVGLICVSLGMTLFPLPK